MRQKIAIILLATNIILLLAEKFPYDDVVSNYSEFFNFGGDKKIAKLDRNNRENAVIKSKVEVLGEVFKHEIDGLKLSGALDLVFLVDASSSIGESNFRSELKFVKKMMSDITVDYNHTRVAIVTFGSAENVIKHVDEISQPKKENNKCLLLNKQLKKIKYTGGGTHTLRAFEVAKSVFENSRNTSKKVLFLITDGFSNGGDPVPLAKELKKQQVTIFTIGIQNGNYKELYELATSPGEMYSYLLDSFKEFEGLARRALHVDLQSGDYIPVGNNKYCDKLCDGGDCCDKNAICTCGTSSGHYSCLCRLGFYGSGLKDSCLPCPSGSYADGQNLCLPCPDVHHVTVAPAIGLSSCQCKEGYQAKDGIHCEVLKCPKLIVPDHGYFVKRKPCDIVRYTACGIRCEVGYTLSGTSIRLCQDNATWSGDNPSCQVKTCDKLPVPVFGQMSCVHTDLGITYNANITELPVDTICTFTCGKGRTLVGSRQRTCLPLARWDGLRTSCKQIKCNKLPQIQNGKVEPNSCATEKQSFGKKCNYVCNEGYMLVGAKTLTCSGQHGSWKPDFEETACVDTTPPELKCPEDVNGTTLPGKNYGSVKWDEPTVTDNSGLNVTIWLKPAIKNVTNFHFKIGKTVVTYFAEDVYKNRAKCRFAVFIKDVEAPVIEDCESPPVFLTTEKQGANVSWDEPNIFDNSQRVEILKSHDFGFFPPGTTAVKYTAVDASNNVNVCVLNVTVEDQHCEALPDPIYGRSDCASDGNDFQCVITCQEGYAVPMGAPTDLINFETDSAATSFICNNSDPIWYNQEGLTFPECSVTTIPKDVQQNGSVLLESKPDATDICNSSTQLNELENDVFTTLHETLPKCTDNNCNFNAKIHCEDDEESRQEEETNVINKRDTETQQRKRKTKKRKKINIKFNVKAEYDKQMLLNGSVFQRNLQKHLKHRSFVEHNATVSLENPKFGCPVGYVVRKNKCVQCPQGTFYNLTINRCQSCPLGYFNDDFGQIACKPCPLHHSTRKLHSKHLKDCKEECPPGTRARKKTIKRRKHSGDVLERRTLKPHCHSCPFGTYQPDFGQTSCIKCPEGFNTSTVRATTLAQCLPSPKTPCSGKGNICNHGQCIPENGYYYSCDCVGNYIGSHCEIKVNGCRSNPCLNNATCLPVDTTNHLDYTCLCKENFTGRFCENLVEGCEIECKNGGDCVQNEEDQYFCLCPEGFGGEFCERPLRVCDEGLCENGGKCVEAGGSFSCDCVDGYIGRRCNILPCDYQPCNGDSICVNLLVDNATKDSYRCECPEGYTGKDCTAPINFCSQNPCLNGGICQNTNTGYICECSKAFAGEHCEIKRNTSYTLKFTRFDTSSYVKLRGFRKDITEITVCLWMKTDDSFNYGTLISFANSEYDNAFTLTDYSSLVFYVNSQHVITDIYLNDGFWHYICALWSIFEGRYSIYIDGNLTQSGFGVSSEKPIKGLGTLVLGQEQDTIGGKFSASESFLGEITYVDFWSKVLTREEIAKNINGCGDDGFGDLYGWPEIQDYIEGDVKVVASNFCQTCDMPKPMYNGLINISDNLAFYKCNPGFVISNPEFENGRKCTKFSEWDGRYEPYCKKITCGHPGYIRNGYIIGRNYFYQDKITYRCYDGYDLAGNSTRICRQDGRWYPEKPVCKGVQCTAFKKPAHSQIAIIAENSYEDFVASVSQFDIGTQVEITCEKNGNLTGERIITCQENGTWDFEPPQCVFDKMEEETAKISCAVEQIPRAPANGYIVIDSINAVGNGTSDTIVYKCRIGYKLKGDNTSVCIVDGYWTEPNVTCDPVLCPTPPKFPNMDVKHINTTQNNYHFGNIANYACAEGYRMYGSDFIRCLANGRWTRMQGKCIKISCKRPNVSAKTKIDGDSYLYEDKVTLTCPNGKKYTLVCAANAEWMGERDDSC